MGDIAKKNLGKEFPSPIFDGRPAERQEFEEHLCSAGLRHAILFHLLCPFRAEEVFAILLKVSVCKDSTHDEECSVKTLDTLAQIHNVLFLNHGGPKLYVPQG